jgi:acetyltransferase-like isoleucine patch superfamily enzyme
VKRRRGLTLDVSPGAEVVIHDTAVLGDGCRIHARAGVVRIGPGAVLGERCVLVAHAGIDIGERARLADEVAVIDFDAVDDDPETPLRLQGVRADPIVVGAGALVGIGAALQRGAKVAPGDVVPPRAVLR